MTGNTATRRLVMLSLLSASGLVFFVFESFLPLLPWFKPGLGNIATLLALMWFGFGDAVKVTVLRIILGALVLGRLFTPLFLLALSGGLVSVLVMALAMKFTARILGPVGWSVLGAAAHNAVQLAVAYLLFVKSAELFIFTPVFMTAGVITGTIVGLVAVMVFDKTGSRLGLDPVWALSGK